MINPRIKRRVSFFRDDGGRRGGWDDGDPHDDDMQLARVFQIALDHSLACETDYDARQSLSYAAFVLNERIKEVFTMTPLLAKPLRRHAELLLSLQGSARVDPYHILIAHRERMEAAQAAEGSDQTPPAANNNGPQM